MSHLTRRTFLGTAGAAGIVGHAPIVRALSLGDVFGTIAGAIGVGLFPGAAAALGGFELVRLLVNANTAVNKASGLIDQTTALENNINSVLAQVSTTLNTVSTFIQDCDKTLQDIDSLLKQLPATLSAAFDAAAAKTALANLDNHRVTMEAYLTSTDSIASNLKDLKHLSVQLSGDISSLNVHVSSDFQFTILAVPGLTTWMQGYTAYNLFKPGAARDQNPWDEGLVSQIALPRIQSLIKAIQSEASSGGGAAGGLPLTPGTLYTSDGRSFKESTWPFQLTYAPGQIDGGLYYTIWPSGTTWQGPQGPVPQGAFPPYAPEPGDFCYLANYPGIVRHWIYVTGALSVPALRDFAFPAAVAINSAYQRLLNASLQGVTAFTQLTNGWEIFNSAVQEKLVTGDRAQWTTYPTLTIKS